MVVPLAGDVDRNNNQRLYKKEGTSVVPLAGDVDRNSWMGIRVSATAVVPLAGDVDRNIKKSELARLGLRRPPRGRRG